MTSWTSLESVKLIQALDGALIFTALHTVLNSVRRIFKDRVIHVKHLTALAWNINFIFIAVTVQNQVFLVIWQIFIWDINIDARCLSHQWHKRSSRGAP